MNARKAIILKAGKFWMMGEQTKHGIQMDIENFASVDEANKWASKNAKNVVFLIGDNHITNDSISKLRLIGNDAIKGISDRKGIKLLKDKGFLLTKKIKKDIVYSLSDKGLSLLKEIEAE